MNADREELQSRLRRHAEEGAENEEQGLMMQSLASLLNVIGECRLQEPYKPLRPVLGADGLRWCCTHDPEHCA
jgi:hypothetical protein